MTNASTPPTTVRTPRAKRVSRACDYCRKKRLKCTPNQRPCLNCQLYHAECTSNDRRRRPVTQIARRGDESVHSAEIESPSDPVIHVSTSALIPSTSSVGLTLASTVGTDGTFDPNLPPPPWSQEEDFGDHSNTNDFGNVLLQLGIGVSSNFWELEQGMLGDLSNVDPSLMDTSVENAPPTPGIASNSGQTGFLPFQDSPSLASQSTVCSANGKVSSIETLSGRDPNEASLQGSVPPGVFIRKNETVANYIGTSSIGATLALCLKDALESQQIPLSPRSLGFLIEAGSFVDEVGLSSMFNLPAQDLPPQDAALRSIDAYFQNLNMFYPILDEDSFRARFLMFYTPDRSQLGFVDYCIFYLVVSIGALSDKHTSGNAVGTDQLAASTYQLAWSMMHDCISSPCETSIQILLLHVVRHIYFGRSGIAWVFCGLALRSAQSLGLHRELPQEMDLPEPQLELRSRLWWMVFSFDASLSLSQGRPCGIMNAAFDKEIVHQDVAMDVDSSLFPSFPQIYFWTHQFNKVQNRFCTLMHSKNTAAARLESIVKVDQDLAAWRDALPSVCRPNNVILVS
ncbi:fungal-specific transcription factor domain-containing protein, partial [Ilyonectria sp. MPI-CAGE-AT-0026]